MYSYCVETFKYTTELQTFLNNHRRTIKEIVQIYYNSTLREHVLVYIQY